MGSDQSSWTPYNYKDCSLGMCSIYCPQFCYFIFPQPPPPDSASTSPFTPLIIAVIGVLVSAFVLVSYYTIVTRYCTRARSGDAEYPPAGNQWQSAAAAIGLEEAAIRSIAVRRYRRAEGLIEAAECAVCLSEFEEEERLRLLPKCGHAFHVPCIDAWLKSHSNCPLCRAAVVAASPPVDSDPCELREVIVVVEEEEQEVPKSPNRNAEEENGARRMRRSVSLGDVRVSKGDFGDDLGRNRCRSSRGLNFA
ncbi:RING-H2 finger protein ATL52-like [Salvia splendens]|uniref:RING-H2 finger protein ATL52-like n=1 Tax=Salvia splendens TaxID=180675 RepID=UPI001C26862E|nr:RING-H2 finger protein ATL52-like [Salvia splendens]